MSSPILLLLLLVLLFVLDHHHPSLLVRALLRGDGIDHSRRRAARQHRLLLRRRSDSFERDLHHHREECVGSNILDYCDDPRSSARWQDERETRALRRRYERDGGILHQRSALTPEEFRIATDALRSIMMGTETTSKTRMLKDEDGRSSFATNRMGAIISNTETAAGSVLYDAFGREGGSMHRLVNAVASSSAAFYSDDDDDDGDDGGGGDDMVLAPDVPIEVRVYEKPGAGMGWHVDDVLYRPVPQVEVVYTMENTSDCLTSWRTTSPPTEERGRRVVTTEGCEGIATTTTSVRTTPNSVLILGAGGVEHMVTPLTYGKRTILKMAFVRRTGTDFDESMAGHASHHNRHRHRRGRGRRPADIGGGGCGGRGAAARGRERGRWWAK